MKVKCPYCGKSFKTQRTKLGRPLKKECDKETVIKLLKEGFGAEKIANSFPGWTRGQVSAIKAHITMGTY